MRMSTNSRQMVVVPAVFLSLGFFVSAAVAQKAPPIAPVREVTETYFGKTVTDPYRWMENTKDPEFVSWLKAQDDATRAVLAKIPGRAQLAERIRALDNAGVSVSGLQWVPDFYFYYKTEPGSDNRKLFVREGLKGTERLLIDPEKRSKEGQHVSIDYFTPSWDGTYVAAGLSVGGSENSTLEVLETKTGRTLPDRIDRAQFGAIAWRQNGKSFFYNRLAKLGPNAAPIGPMLGMRISVQEYAAKALSEPIVKININAPDALARWMNEWFMVPPYYL